MSAPEAALKENSGRSVRPRPVPSQAITPAITPAAELQAPPLLLPGEWAAFPRGPTGGGAYGAQTPPLAWRGRVPTRRRQGDNDITSAAGFGTFRAAELFGRRWPLLGNTRQARSQGQAPRGRRRTPVHAVLAGPCSEPPSRIPEGCQFRSSPLPRPHPGPSCRPGASSLLITLSLPLFRAYPTVPIFTAITLSQATHPSPLSWTTAIASQVVFPLPCLYSLSSTWHPKLLSRVYQTKSLLYNTLHRLSAHSA